jgi:N6-adenosine-specific RNA methylase IME4
MTSARLGRIQARGFAELGVRIDRIVVPPERMRQLRPEKVADLAESIAVRGLLQPIVVRPRGANSYWLVFGRHRLEAVRQCGHSHIIAIIVDGLDADAALLAEIDENLIRADLSPAERALHVARRKELYERLYPETKHGGDRKSVKVKSSRQNGELKRFTENAAKNTGRSERTIQRDIQRAKIIGIADLVGTSLDQGDELDALAKLPEEEQRKLVERAKAGEPVTARQADILAAAKVIRAEKNEERRAAYLELIGEISKGNTALPLGVRYPVILADPPWLFEGYTSVEAYERTPKYPTMSLVEICALPVRDLACDPAILFLWSTSAHLRLAFDVIEAWGFSYSTSAVWCKSDCAPGLGHFVRQQHETLLIARRGDFPTPSPSVRPSSVIRAPRREHSRKPDEVYAIIEAMYPDLPRLEMFARKARPGWTVWGNEAPPAMKVAS